MPHDIITAVPLSFHDDGSLDLDGSRVILDYVAASGVQGALVLGTTGEFPALSIDERNQIARLSVEALSGLRVVVHVGAASSYEVARLIEGARDAGATEIAVLTPFYLPTPPDEVYEYFRRAAELADGLDVFIYLFEARTGVEVDEELLVRLSALPNVVGAKLSGVSLETVARIRAITPPGFLVYTGSDGDFARAGDAGADGVISGVASAFPKPFLEMQAALRAGDPVAIDAAQTDVDEVVAAIEGAPSRMRAVHRLAGRRVGRSRMSIPEPEGSVLERLERATPRFN
jgi:4-hydroxy-tetrahydrodipicolinate synthase